MCKNNFSDAMMSRLPFVTSDREDFGGVQNKLYQALDKSPGESAMVDLLPYTAGAGQSEEQG
jgi:hypothetical protein